MLKERFALYYHLLVIADVVALSAAFVASYMLAPYAARICFGDVNSKLDPLTNYLWLLLIILPCWMTLLHYKGRYLPMAASGLPELTWFVFRTGVLSAAAMALVLYATKYPLSRIFVSFNAIFGALFVFVEKTTIRWYLELGRRMGWYTSNVLLVGADRHAALALTRMSSDPRFHAHIVGCLGLAPGEVGGMVDRVTVTDTVDHYRAQLLCHSVDEVLIAPTAAASRLFGEILEFCRMIGVTVRIIPDYWLPQGEAPGRVIMEDFLGVPTVSFYSAAQSPGPLLAKRLVDVTLSAALLVVLSPLLLATALLVKLTSKGPVLYRWKVVGRTIRPFTGYKFRTMVANADELKPQLAASNEMQGPAFKMRQDPRITPLGRFLRKYSLDELPQLWSVLKGDMSLVGPRPPSPTELDHFDAWHRRKLSIKPGMTCLWQVNGRNQIHSFDDWVKLDLEYIDNWSLWLDCKILLKTAIVVAKGTGV